MIRVTLTSLLEKEYGAGVHVYGFQITSVKPDSITLEIDMEISTEATLQSIRGAKQVNHPFGMATASKLLRAPQNTRL
jgi:hypothetical protein